MEGTGSFHYRNGEEHGQRNPEGFLTYLRPGAAFLSKTVRKVSLVRERCGGFGKLKEPAVPGVLDRPSYPGKTWVNRATTLCIPFRRTSNKST